MPCGEMLDRRRRAPGTARPPASRRSSWSARTSSSPSGSPCASRGVLLVRRAVADDGCRTMISVGRLGRRCDASTAPRRCASLSLASRDVQHVPAVGREARRHVLAEGQLGVALDRDVVAVVDPAEIGQLQMAGERGRLAARCLPSCRRRCRARRRGSRTAAKSGPVEVRRRASAAAIAMPTLIAARPGRAGRWSSRRRWCSRYSGWPGRLAVELAEMLDVVERDDGRPCGRSCSFDRLDAGQMQQRIQQHRRVAARTARSGRDWARSGRAGS